jgi:hypothetical protein
VASARAKYRALSKAWHSFLRFSIYITASSNKSLKRFIKGNNKDGREKYKRTCLDDLDIKAEIQRRAEQELLKGILKSIKL